ncbi:MAG: hypothetical protein ACREMA_17925, partial [Longimicrobiales bacterium]
ATLSLGADSTLPIVLPAAQSPRLAGTIRRDGPAIHFEPADGAGVRLADGTSVQESLAMASDRTESATTLAIGTLRLRVHGEPGTDRLWLRAWDVEHPARDSFTLPESYAPDTVWRVAARFEPY